MKIKNYLLMMLVGLCAAACSNDKDEPQGGSVVSSNMTNLNVSAYDKWTYIDLKTGKTETHPDTNVWIYKNGTTTEAKAPETVGVDWQIAIHRYEIRTNGGSVIDTKLKNMNEVKALPPGDYKEDETITNEDKEYPIITDMKHMADDTGLGVGYAKTATVNRVLCGWVKKTKTGSMPPTIYEATKNVLILKCKDGSWAKIQLTAAGNTETGKSGFVSFNYEFIPVK